VLKVFGISSVLL